MKPQPIDITRERFGKLTVQRRSTAKPGVGHWWECRCDCGVTVLKPTNELRAGRATRCSECACVERVTRIVAHRKAARSKFPKKLRKVWDSMKRRCYLPHATFYSEYGGRGITICDEWLESSVLFFEWSMANGYAEGLSIDRIDNDAGYSPGNCRWVDHFVQSANRRSVVNLTWNGETRNITDWAKHLGVKKGTLWMRVKMGWPVERIFTQPYRIR